jgi:hypothetical protein
VCEAAGAVWTRAFRASLGVEGGCDPFAQAAAACRLYAETAKVLDGDFDDETKSIVATALAMAAD